MSGPAARPAPPTRSSPASPTPVRPWLGDTALLVGAFCLAEVCLHPVLRALPELEATGFANLLDGLLLAILCAPLFAWTLYRRAAEARLPVAATSDTGSPHRRVRFAMQSSLAFVFAASGLLLWNDVDVTTQIDRNARLIDVAERQMLLSQRIGWLTARLDCDDAAAQESHRRALAVVVAEMARDEAELEVMTTAAAPATPDDQGLVRERLAQAYRCRSALLGAAQRLLHTAGDRAAGAEVQDLAESFLPAMASTQAAIRLQVAARQRDSDHAKATLVGTWSGLFLLLCLLVVEPIARIVRRQHAASTAHVDQVRQLAAVAQHTHNAVAITDTARHIVWVNDGFTRITGYSLAEALGQSPGRLLQSERTDPATVAAMRAALNAERPFRGEIENRRKNGADYWLELEIQPLRGERGELVNFLAIESDITARKAAERELRTAKARAETALREIEALRLALDEHSILSTADRSGRILDVNTGFLRISGFTREELLGQDHRILSSGAHPKSFWTHLWRTIAAGRAWRGEVCNRRKDGSRYWVDSTIVPVKAADGQIEKYVSIRFDITAQKAAEAALVAARSQAESASAAKSEFLANMSHEIRTPMTAILGFAELLANDGEGEGLGARRLEYAETIRRNGEHLLGILNDILDLSKIEAGKLAFEAATTHPVQLVHEVMALMQVKAQAKGLQLVAEFATAVPEQIQSDELRLRQILVNLVGNAIKFTEVGKVSLRVGCDRAEERLWFEVRDTGIGMSSEQVARLFAPFEQVDTSAKRRFGGTGLGLHISKRLAEMLGGDLTVASELGQGSLFRLTVRTGALATVPLVATEAIGRIVGEPENPAWRAPAASRSLAGVRILLAEDGPDNQRLISYHLRKEGAEVQVVDNGLRAVSAFTVGGEVGGALLPVPPFDVLVTDMQMPEMDGYAATQLLRRKGLQLPIVALTANAMEGDRERCLAAGCDAYATKPIHRGKLIEACREAMQRHRNPVPAG